MRTIFLFQHVLKCADKKVKVVPHVKKNIETKLQVVHMVLSLMSKSKTVNVPETRDSSSEESHHLATLIGFRQTCPLTTWHNI